MSPSQITLLGGTGFIGRALAARLAADGASVRVVARHAESAGRLPEGVEAFSADVRDARALRAALSGSDAAVYLPGLVQGRRRRPFEELHSRAAEASAHIARECRLSRFIHVSALGAAADAPAWSDQTKAEGEKRVLRAFPKAVVVRPSLVLGAEDHFGNEMIGMMRRLPFLPVIGPDTRVQPVHVDDMVTGLRRLLLEGSFAGGIVQAAGPRVWRMIELLGALRDQAGLRCRLLPLPHWAAMAIAVPAGLLPEPPLCPDQVRLMRTDKIASPAHPGLADLDITPRDPSPAESSSPR